MLWAKAWLGLIVFLVAVGAAAAGAEDGGWSEERLRVMTYNINHGAGHPCTPKELESQVPSPDCSVVKLQLAADGIRSHSPDVVGLQEVDRLWARSGYVDQVTLLATELGMHSCYGANVIHGPDEHSVFDHRYGNAILSRAPIASCSNTNLPRADPRTEPRGLLQAVVPIGGTPLWIFNTHLQNCSSIALDPCGPANPDRRLQVGAILDHIGQGRPAILIGDFNADPHWPELQPIHERFGDAWRLAGGSGEGDTYPAQPIGEPYRRLDFIFLQDVEAHTAFVPVSAETRTASDHYPVVSDLSRRDAAPVWR